MEIEIPSFSVLLTLFLFVLMVIKLTLTKRAQTSNSASKLPPGPWKLPLVGNMHQIFSSLPHRTLRDLANKHGPFMYLRIGQVPTIVVSSPEFAKLVMRTHDLIFASRPRLLSTQIMLYGPTDIGFSPYGEYWRQLRKICVQELLSTTRVQSFRHIREGEMLDLAEWIASNVGSSINITERISLTTYKITSRAAFGNRSNDNEEFIQLVAEASEAFGSFHLVDMFPSFGFLAPITSRARSKLEKMKQRSDRILESIIEEHKDRKKAAKSTDEGENIDEDLVDVLLKFHDNNELGFSLTTDNVKAVIWDMFSAGSETSATTVNWAMAEMIKNPRVMKKAVDEVRQALGEKGSIDETIVSEMSYLKCVVKETLRLHPPGPLLVPRECRANCEINGYEIPEKTRIIVNAWAIGRDSRYWTEPESFIPERFIDSSIAYNGTSFEYIPFGAGRRICPGISFGLNIVELQLASFLYHFDWKLPNGMKHEDLDMTELFGLTVGRMSDLYLIPVAYHSSNVAT